MDYHQYGYIQFQFFANVSLGGSFLAIRFYSFSLLCLHNLQFIYVFIECQCIFLFLHQLLCFTFTQLIFRCLLSLSHFVCIMWWRKKLIYFYCREFPIAFKYKCEKSTKYRQQTGKKNPNVYAYSHCCCFDFWIYTRWSCVCCVYIVYRFWFYSFFLQSRIEQNCHGICIVKCYIFLLYSAINVYQLLSHFYCYVRFQFLISINFCSSFLQFQLYEMKFNKWKRGARSLWTQT